MLAPPSSGARGRSPARELTLTPASPYSRSRQQAMDEPVGDKVEVMRAGEKPSSAVVTELTPLGSFVTWQGRVRLALTIAFASIRKATRLASSPARRSGSNANRPLHPYGVDALLKIIFSHLCKPMEVTVKVRLLLTSALFLFAQMPTMQAQETLDLAKITCEQFEGQQLASPSRDIVLLLAGYYNGKRNNTVIEPQKIKKEVQEVDAYCYQHRETILMDAVKNVLGFDK